MPSYLYQEQPVPIQPFQSPLELYAQTLATKDAKVRSELSNIRNYYDSILNTPLTNAANQQTLRDGVQKAMDKLSKSAVTDLTLPENVASIEGVFDPILNNKDIIYDAAWTSNHRRELSKAQELQKSKPELVPPQNLEPLYLAQQNYEKSDPGSRPGFTSFSPYYDFNTKMNTDLDKIKTDVDNQIIQGKGITIQGPDGSSIYVDNISQQQLKQIKESKVAEIAWNKLHTDAQAMNQMSLDYSYNTNHGLLTPGQAQNDIDGEIAGLKSTVEYYNLGANTKNIDKALADSKIKGLNERITELSDLKNQIKIDPSKSKDYYTFSKSIKDYIEGKVSQYSYKDEGKLEDVPFYGKLRDYQFDLMKEQWTAKWKFEDEQRKANAKTQEKLTQPGITPLKDLILRLEESPTGKISAPATDVQALGNFAVKDGKFFHSFSQSGANPQDELIIQPATNDLSQAQTYSLNQAQVLYGLKRDLNAAYAATGDKNKGSGSSIFDILPGYQSADQAAQEKEQDNILTNIATNPNYYGNGTERTKAINGVLAKYGDLLKRVNIDLKDPKNLLDVQAGAQDPAVSKAMTYGQTLNGLNGDFQVVFDNDNVVKGDNGLIYVKGKMIVPESRLSHVSDLIESGMATDYGTGVWGGDDEGKYKKSNERLIAVNFYKPANGDLADINDQMLKNSKRLEGQGDNAMYIAENSRKEMKQFSNDLQLSDAFNFSGLKFSKTTGDNYVIENGADNIKAMKFINDSAWDISVRTGLPSQQVQQDMTNILANNSLPLRRIEALRNYETNATTQNNLLKQNFGTSNINPSALKTWSDIASEYPVTNLGFWGDEAHKTRASDHNTGNAVDIGIQSSDIGTQIADQLKSEAAQRNIKYIIFNGKIWNPSISKEWRPYTGENDHSTHIHVSFN